MQVPGRSLSIVTLYCTPYHADKSRAGGFWTAVQRPHVCFSMTHHLASTFVARCPGNFLPVWVSGVGQAQLLLLVMLALPQGMTDTSKTNLFHQIDSITLHSPQAFADRVGPLACASMSAQVQSFEKVCMLCASLLVFLPYSLLRQPYKCLWRACCNMC